MHVFEDAFVLEIVDPDTMAPKAPGEQGVIIQTTLFKHLAPLVRFLPRTIDEDQWQAANRAMYWLWTEYALKRGVRPRVLERPAGSRPRVNIIGPIYGTFNMPLSIGAVK